ncbi:LacI family DNA-binding transcriptional regulator [Ensifer sp.]|uniref:LacI family DNA-binding transcriptional regulator n=1 Tax=Ensifer sp. TaxID=1872086 RepID=UPI0013AF991B|nr:LacI family DNA-binding transcriptional regulator [Ensifer sp.]
MKTKPPGPRSRKEPSQAFVTAQDVADLAGVSRAAVSRTFTDGASVSKETRERVVRAAEALGYRVNRLAQSLSGGNSNLVGIVVANMSSPHMSHQLDQLSGALLRRGMQSLLLNASAISQDISQLLELILEFRVRAVVILSGTPPEAIIEECMSNNVRMVLVDRSHHDDVDNIVSDDAEGARLAADRLIAAGCTQVAVVSARKTSSQFRRRTEFIAQMQKAGIKTIAWSMEEPSYDAGKRAGFELLGNGGVDGVFCVTDLLALGMLDAARVLSKSVPHDVSVIGFDDIPQASWEAYQLTTIRRKQNAIAAAILEAIEREDAAGVPLHCSIPVELIERRTARTVSERD